MKKALLSLLFSFFFWYVQETHFPPIVTTSGNFSVDATSQNISIFATSLDATALTTELSKFPPNPMSLKVGIIGSSTAVGTSGTSTVDSSYVALFKNYYQRYWHFFDTLYNLAVGGTDPRYALPTGWPGSHSGFPGSIDTSKSVTALIKRGVNLVIMDFPTNAYDALTISNIMIYYQAIHDSVVLSGAKFRCWGTQPRPGFDAATKAKLIVINDSLRNRFGPAGEFMDRFYTLADPLNLLTYRRAYAYSDSIHTTNIGHRRIFDKIRTLNIFRAFVNSADVITNPFNAIVTVTPAVVGTYLYHAGAIDAVGQGGDTVLTGQFTSLPPPTTNGRFIFHGHATVNPLP